jgi:hypothetical protein
MLILVYGGGCRLPPQRQVHIDPAHQAHLRRGDLEVVIRDNSAFGVEESGYNGIAFLSHKREPRNLFNPAGLNFEHIFDGERRPEIWEERVEPRYAPMTLTRVSTETIQLHQPPTPQHRLESWTTLTLTPPHYIDFMFECTPRAESYPRGYIGLFWASYLNAPENLAIHFIGKAENERSFRWVQHASNDHNVRSTVRFINEGRIPTFGEGHAPTLYTDFAEVYYAYPFYYGRYRDMVYLVMFDRTEGIRLTMSPRGAGRNRDGTTNPAWDWHWFLFNPQVGQKYSYRARVVYKPWVSPSDVVSEYERWSGRQVTF